MLVLTGMRQKLKIDPQNRVLKMDVAAQDKLCKSLYDRIHHCRVGARLIVPSNLWNLLDIEECTIIQKKWLMFFCSNKANWVDACDKTFVKIPMYRKWTDPGTKSHSNKKFQEAHQDIEDAYVEMGEAKLKEMVASKNSAAVIFYMKNKHESYKTTAKTLIEDKKAREKGYSDFSKVSKEKKRAAFMQNMGMIKPVNEEDEISVPSV